MQDEEKTAKLKIFFTPGDMSGVLNFIERMDAIVMDRSFYHFALTYRGKTQPDDFSRFADAVFLDHAFPRATKDFDKISRYLEERAHPLMKASIFDEMWNEYISR